MSAIRMPEVGLESWVKYAWVAWKGVRIAI
jgi:hypothetical protein